MDTRAVGVVAVSKNFLTFQRECCHAVKVRWERGRLFVIPDGILTSKQEITAATFSAYREQWSATPCPDTIWVSDTVDRASP